MGNTSSRTHMVSFRLTNEAYNKILVALETPSNGNTSVGDYCKQVIERHAFRHSTRKYRNSSFKLEKDNERDKV